MSSTHTKNKTQGQGQSLTTPEASITPCVFTCFPLIVLLPFFLHFNFLASEPNVGRRAQWKAPLLLFKFHSQLRNKGMEGEDQIISLCLIGLGCGMQFNLRVRKASQHQAAEWDLAVLVQSRLASLGTRVSACPYRRPCWLDSQGESGQDKLSICPFYFPQICQLNHSSGAELGKGREKPGVTLKQLASPGMTGFAFCFLTSKRCGLEAVAHICHPSALGGPCGRIVWVQECEAAVS